MARFRILLVLLVGWLILIFNLERPEINLGGLTTIDLDSFVYGLFAFAAVSLLLLPDIAKHSKFVYIIFTLAYLIGKVLFGSPSLSDEWPFVITELTLIYLTIALFQQVSQVVAHFEQTVEDVILGPEHLNILSLVQGEEQIDRELFRARRFERPVTLLVIRIPGAKGANMQFDMETSLQRRYIQVRVAKIIRSLTYKGDSILWDADQLVVCLPETTREEAVELSRIIYKQIKMRQSIGVQIGKAEFPHDGLIYQQLLQAAKEDAKHYSPPTITSEFPVIQIDDDEDEGDAESSGMNSDSHSDNNHRNVRSQETLSFIKLAWDIFDPIPHVHVMAGGAAAVYDDLGDPDFWLHDIPYQSPTSKALFRIVKRIADLGLVLVSLPLVLPVALMLALIIRLQDGGSIFFIQKRTGLGGRRFKMYKFRTMVPDAEEKLKELAAEGKAVLNEEGKLAQPLKLDRDPRITRIGRILRKTSLDELPQLYNVLRGDMSLVGPRPTSWGLDNYSLLHTERLSVRPGITGLWQVCDRGNTDFDNWVEWDMAYIDRMCLALDIKILVQTFSKVLKHKGAR